MDPILLSVLSATLGGVGGQLAQIGSDWLREFFKDHGAKAQDAARENSLEFLNDLAQRIKQLEAAGIKSSVNGKESLDRALEDPDFSAILKTAIIASARTSDSEKHKVLSRAVAERLSAPQDGLVALASNLAIEAIPHLSSKHLNLLGLASLVAGIRPAIQSQGTLTDEFVQTAHVLWFRRNLPFFLPIEISTKDLMHMVSTACIKFEPFVGRDLTTTLFGRERFSGGAAETFLNSDPLAKQLQDVWQNGHLESVTLTTAGDLIGTYVVDQKCGTTTRIDW